MEVKDEFLSFGKFELGDGSQVQFWEDTRITSRPLKSIFSALYNIVRRKGASIRMVLFMIPERIKMPKRGGELGFSKNLSNL